MSSNQKKIRDVERMMKKFGNTPDLMAKLEAAKQSKGEVQVKEKMRKNSTKYHMVKFLERKKVTRMVRSVETKIKKEEEGSTELEALNKKRDTLLSDLAYIMYYPMEHKYIALFPAKSNEDKADNSDGEEEQEKSKVISQKARVLALQRWEEDKGFGGDKVAYAMEVEYKGGAAAAETAPGRAIAATREQQKTQLAEKAGKKSAEKKVIAGDKGKKVEAVKPASSSVLGKRSAETSSDGESSDSDSDSDSSGSSDEEKKKIAKPAATKDTPKAAAKEESEASDNDNDDFFMEEASESELANANAAPKVYQDGNTFRYKEERKSVHEIRFAATKRKYERHKRVFNNQNQRGGSDRKKSR